MLANHWGVGPGIDAIVTSTLPDAAGLSSSSALLIAVTLALLEARGFPARFRDLMEILPDGEMYIGTRGGGMDQDAPATPFAFPSNPVATEPETVIAVIPML